MTVVRSWNQNSSFIKYINIEFPYFTTVDCILIHLLGTGFIRNPRTSLWVHVALRWPLLSEQVLSLSPETWCLKEQHWIICSALGFIVPYMFPCCKLSNPPSFVWARRAAGSAITHFHCKSHLKTLGFRSATGPLDQKGKSGSNLAEPELSYFWTE